MITYKSRRTGAVYEFVESDGNILSSSDFRGWEWSASTINGSSRYSRGSRDLKATLTFSNFDDAQRFFALADTDTEEGVEALFSVTGWEMRGNVMAGSINLISVDETVAQYEVTFHSDWPVWRKEVGRWSFPVSSGSASGGLDYPHDYPHDYSPPPSGQRTIDVDALRASDFELIVYGPASNPSVTIAGVRHEVNCEVPSGSLLFVNSMNNRTGDEGTPIFIRNSDGSTENMFKKRGREWDIFSPIQPGSNLITWSGLFGFDLITYETRGVRPWT